MLRLLSCCRLLQLTDTLLISFWVWHLWRGMIFEVISLAVCLCLKLLWVSSRSTVDHFIRVCTALRALIVVETRRLCATIVPLRRCWLNHGYHADWWIFIAYPTGFNLIVLNPFQLLEPTQIGRLRHYRAWLWILFAQGHSLWRLIRIMSTVSH